MAIFAPSISDSSNFCREGRLIYWHPAHTSSKRTALQASHPELVVRFLKESSTTKTAWYPELDHLDLQVRAETLKARSEPCMLQLCVVPAYGEHHTENLL